MDICFILWNTIHPSNDLVSCSNYPRFVHLKLLQLVLVPFQDAIILFLFFLALFKLPATMRGPGLPLWLRQ